MKIIRKTNIIDDTKITERNCEYSKFSKSKHDRRFKHENLSRRRKNTSIFEKKR